MKLPTAYGWSKPVSVEESPVTGDVRISREWRMTCRFCRKETVYDPIEPGPDFKWCCANAAAANARGLQCTEKQKERFWRRRRRMAQKRRRRG